MFVEGVDNFGKEERERKSERNADEMCPEIISSENIDAEMSVDEG